MKRVFFIALLVLSNGAAYGEWELATETEAGTKIYMDYSTIRRKDNLVEMWDLYDFASGRSVKDKTFLSAKTQREYDCIEKSVRILAFTNFSGHMGRGNVVQSIVYETEWEPVKPRSLAKSLWDIACSMKYGEDQR